MDNEQAKLILTAYRPGGEDATDPYFAEALEQAQLDQELGQWLAAQRQHDQSLQAAIQSIAPPASLRQVLLLNRKVVHFNSAPSARRWIVPLAWTALAAAVALLIGLISLLPSGTPRPAKSLSAAQLAEAVHELKINGEITLGKMASHPDDLRAWLATQGAPSHFPLPASLTDLETIGCQTFLIDGIKVSLICFRLDKNQLVHLFVVDDQDMIDRPGRAPTLTQWGDFVAATWSADGRTFLLTGINLDEKTLRRLV